MSKQDSIEFYELIGAPLLGFVQAEHQAAQATLEMVEQLGFEHTSEGKRLRTTAFFTEKCGADGRIERTEHQIPILSLMPIPMMQTKHADLEFGIKINDFELSATSPGLASTEEDNGFMAPRRLQMKASLGRMDAGDGGQHRGAQMDMRIKLTIQPGDFPNGISRLLRLMDEAGYSRPLPEGENKA
ncbi:DUF2589 domain-containing protein [Musicola keenii]|uniref:DUF2589 domain-containing protein n=1 Tax=Musicola keenii TaxID=2884250 RepID=UPI00177EFB29|nr:DUF2589 domain-containing protein [Musicola keenii]